MLRVRTIKTTSSATAVQVVKYEKGKRIIVKHIGSAHTPQKLEVLRSEAKKWIEKVSGQKSLFSSQEKDQSQILLVNKSQYLGHRYTFIYDTLRSVAHLFKFHYLRNPFLLDLVIIRIIEPVSKLESLEYLSELFGITYGKSTLYQTMLSFPQLKKAAEEKTVTFAQKQFNFDFSIVFYDVTTLYFESFKEDEEGFKKLGFSKDNKANQPQIVIGLIVTAEGFPVAYEIFPGNTFEGKTFIPTITKFKDTYKVKTLTIVADAAMISFDNIEKLKEEKLSYIVGARIANLKRYQMETISAAFNGQTQDQNELQQKDGVSTRIETERGVLLCDFSFKRYQKDKREMEKQIQKAENLLLEGKGVKRTKFLKNKEGQKTEQELNMELIEKTKLLLGIKGYYTNLVREDDKTIINHYHSLWHVEQAFRIAKSDLAMRPIYHFKKQTIEAHILICFMALAICRYMELKTGKSTKKIIKLLKSVTEARILNKLTGEEIIMRQELPDEVTELWKTLLQPH